MENDPRLSALSLVIYVKLTTKQCHRSYATRVENEVRPRSHEIRCGAGGSITVWFGRLRPTNPATSPIGYVVNAGDTLQSIAMAVFGDAKLWYLVADVNGFSNGAVLTAM